MPKSLRRILSALRVEYEDVLRHSRSEEFDFEEFRARGDKFYELDRFSDEQMDCILAGIAIGLDDSQILAYAKPEIDAYTMEKAYFAFSDGLSKRQVKKELNI